MSYVSERVKTQDLQYLVPRHTRCLITVPHSDNQYHDMFHTQSHTSCHFSHKNMYYVDKEGVPDNYII